jgi:hypothetical protein
MELRSITYCIETYNVMILYSIQCIAMSNI